MTDEEELKLKTELETLKKQRDDLLAKSKTEEGEGKEAEAKRRKEKPDSHKVDPDLLKEVAQMKLEIAELKGKKTGEVRPSFRLNFFGEDT